MNLSDVGLALIKQFEGLELKAYRDAVGVLSIGYGHTGPDVQPGMVITPQEADRLLRKDVEWAEELVRKVVTVPLTESMFDALVSIMFNVGPGRRRTLTDDGKDGIVTLKDGRPSTLLRYLNSKQYRAARDQFPAWSLAGGRRLNGLLRRRTAEAELFERDGYAPEGS